MSARAGEQARPIEPARLAELIAGYASDVKAQDIVELDLRGVLGYTDYFVIASGGTDRQAKAIHDRIHENMKKQHGLLPRRVEGLSESRWILMDYLDVIVHIFTPEARDFYRLEQLWGEAPKRTSSSALRRDEGRPSGGLISGARGTRTPDLLTASQALSQLSYSPGTGPRRSVARRHWLSASRGPPGNRRPALTSARHGRAPLQPARDRAQVAGDLGARAHLGGVRRRRRHARARTCSRCCRTRPASPTWGI